MPVARREEIRLGFRALVPRVQRRLTRIREHLEGDGHVAARVGERLDHLQLDAVRLDARMRFADEDETRLRQPRAELARRDRLARGCVGDGIERDGGIPVLPRRIANREPVDGILGPAGVGAREQEGGGKRQSHWGIVQQ